MPYRNALWVFWLTTALFTPIWSLGEASQLPLVVPNDNRTPAGDFKQGVLNLHLELREARWYAEADGGVYKDVYVFGEEGRPPQSSGPLVRVPQGTPIHTSLHNLLPT